jgi:TonB-dependent SusC/RagA subfamily outer membrane receptor
MQPHRSTHLRTALLGLALAASAACHRATLVDGTDPIVDEAGRAEARAERMLRMRQLEARGEVDVDEWRGRSVVRIEEMLVNIPGVQVTALPGRGFSVRIRGASSFYGSTEPLFVLDGMPLNSGPNGLVGISPGDVRRIEVLKDAGSLAMYGVRGANGVILITTGRRP